MATHIQTEDEFEAYKALSIEHKAPLFMKFTATWCGPCKKISPRFDELARQYQDRAYFVEIDVDKMVDVSQQYKVSSIPRFIVLQNGKQEDSWVGAAIDTLTTKVQEHCGSKPRS